MERFGVSLTEEQALLQELVRDFARERVAPGAAARDLSHDFPAEVIAEAGALGLMGAKVPEALGGPGVDSLGYLLAIEALAEADASVAVVAAASNLAASILVKHATAEQASRWLPPLCAGELGPLAFCLSEPGCGSDAASLTTTARPDGDGWRLTGSKMWITAGAHAGLCVVFARLPDTRGPEGITCFLVPGDAPGLEVGKEERKMGQRASGTVALHLDDCRVGPDQLLGAAGGGYRLALAALAGGRAGIAGLSIGIAEAALAEGLRYVDEREAFGRPLSKFQNTRFVLADCRMELDAAWLLGLRAAQRLDAGHRADSECAMAKLYGSEACGRIVDRVLQLHGGYGYSEEYAIERLYRDARVLRIYEGTSEIQRMVIARELLGR